MSATIPAGYKQTEVGVTPEDWVFGELGDLNPVVTSGSRGWAKYYFDLGAAFLRITNLTRESIYIDLSDLRLVKLPQNNAEGLRTQLQVGDLLISITADIGIIGFVDSTIPSPAYINQHIALLRFDESKVDTKFLSYFLASEKPQSAFRAGTDQGAKAGINLSGIRKIQAVFPPLPEQRAIAAALSDVDALLAKLDQLINKKRNLKQATMQQLLTGQTRLPGFSGAWEVKRLGEVVDIRKGQLITEKDAIAGDVPVIAGGKKPSYFHNQSNRVGKTITVSASGASAGYVAFFSTPIFASDCSTVSESKAYSIEYIYFQLLLKQETIYKAQTGGAQPHIHAVDLKPLEIGLCPKEEQTAIATVLSDMDTELAALEARRDKTRSLKQGMMQELLTGRIRLV
jgi:type I restriction enzyme S subunit